MIELMGELICATPEEAERVREHLEEHIRLTREEAGCLLFEVLPVGGGIWTVHEQFTDAAAFEAHQARVGKSAWGAATTGIRRVYDVREVPDVAPVEAGAEGECQTH